MREELLVLSAVLVLSTAACTKQNPSLCCTSPDDCTSVGLSSIKTCSQGLYCANHACVPAACLSDAECPADHPVCAGTCVDCDATHVCPVRTPVCDLTADTCGLCVVDMDCTPFSTTPHCDVVSGGCVECTESAQCPSASPVCDQNRCRPCKADADCESDACDVDGTCVPEQNVVYLVAPGGADTGSCTRSAPCATITYALGIADATRNHISLMYAGEAASRIAITPTLTTATSLFIHGHGAVFKPGVNSTLPIFDTKLPLTLRDVQLYGNVIPVTTQNSVRLTLDHVTIHDAQRLALTGPLVATNLTIYSSVDSTAAIVATGGYDITIDRALIYLGTAALVVPPASHVHLSNMLIWGTSSRALELSSSAGELMFSTIAGAGQLAQSAPCSVSCGGGLHVTSSIIWQPQCVNGTTQDAVGPCTFVSSIVSNALAPPGTTNADPLFVDAAAGNYHIQPASPARDAVDTGPDHDFEGDPRPGGPKYDIGADEIP